MLALLCSLLPTSVWAQLQVFSLSADQDFTVHLSKHQLNRLTLVNDTVVSVHQKSHSVKMKQDASTGDLYWLAPHGKLKVADPFFITTAKGVTFSFSPKYDRNAPQTLRLEKLNKQQETHKRNVASEHSLTVIQDFFNHSDQPHSHFRIHCRQHWLGYPHLKVLSCISHQLDNGVILDYQFKNTAQTSQKIFLSDFARHKDVAIFSKRLELKPEQRSHIYFLRRAHV